MFKQITKFVTRFFNKNEVLSEEAENDLYVMTPDGKVRKIPGKFQPDDLYVMALDGRMIKVEGKMEPNDHFPPRCLENAPKYASGRFFSNDPRFTYDPNKVWPKYNPNMTGADIGKQIDDFWQKHPELRNHK